MFKKLLPTLFVIIASACLSQFAEPQTSKSTSPKAESVKKLIDLTFPTHPYVSVEAQLDSLPKAKEMAAIDKQNQIKTFNIALNANKKLTAEQILFVIDRYERLGKSWTSK